MVMSVQLSLPLQHVALAVVRGLDLLLAAGMILGTLPLQEQSDVAPLVAELQLQLQQQVVGLQGTDLLDQSSKHLIALGVSTNERENEITSRVQAAPACFFADGFMARM